MTEPNQSQAGTGPTSSRAAFYDQLGNVASAAQKLALEQIPELTAIITVPVWNFQPPPDIPAAILMCRGPQGLGNTMQVVQHLIDALHSQLRTLTTLLENADGIAKSMADEIRIQKEALEQLTQHLKHEKEEIRAGTEPEKSADVPLNVARPGESAGH